MPSVIAYMEGALSVCGVFVFVILFIMIHVALRQSKMFGRCATIILSFCVTSLSMIGMELMFASGQSNGIRVILIPYGLLGLFLLIMFLLMSTARLCSSDKTDKHVKKPIPPGWAPPGKKTKPVIPPDLPLDLNIQSPPKSHVSTDCVKRTLRDIDFREHAEPNPRPSENKAMAYSTQSSAKRIIRKNHETNDKEFRK